jgi:type II secretory pathway component PulF
MTCVGYAVFGVAGLFTSNPQLLYVALADHCLLGPPIFEVLDLVCRHLVGLLGEGISLLQGLNLYHNTAHTQERHKHTAML